MPASCSASLVDAFRTSFKWQTPKPDPPRPPSARENSPRSRASLLGLKREARERGEFSLALGGRGGSGFGVCHLNEVRNASTSDALQLAGIAEGSHRKKRQQACYRNSQNDQPARRVAGPGAKRGVEPAQRQNRKRRADNFVKKLPEDAPQAAKTARGGSGCRARGGGHKSILTQNRPPNRNRNAMRR